MKIEDKLADFKNKIDPLIKKYLEDKIEKYQKIFPESILLIDQVKDLTLRGGDRIRPALFYYGFKLIKDPNTLEKKELLRLSTAFETFHSFALIHDDIIDNGILRRGKKTVNKYFDDYFGSNLGDRLAILSGDMAEIFCQEIFQSRMFGNNFAQALAIFIQMKEETIIGEYMDTVYPLLKKFPDVHKIKKVLCFKSAYYSVQKPLVIGALLAGANESQTKMLSLIGEDLGLAFQIRDDILGIFGKQELTGKSVLSDIIEGKRTLLIMQTLQRLAKKKDKIRLQKLLGKKDILSKDVLWIKKIIKDSGALNYCQKECGRLVTDAKSKLEKNQFDQEAKTFLIELSDFIIQRKY